MAIKFGSKDVIAVYKGSKKVEDIIRNGASYLKPKKKSMFEQNTGMTMLAFINNGYAEDGKAYDSKGQEIPNWETYWTYYAPSTSVTSNGVVLKSSTLQTEIPVIVNKTIITNAYRMFYNKTSLTTLDLSNWDTSNITNMSGIFAGCTKLTTINLSNFDTSKVTDMSNMFDDCKVLTSLDLSSFDTSNVTTMKQMFSDTKLPTYDLSSFDTSKVEIFQAMFSWSNVMTSLDISNFDTSSAKNMQSMFNYCTKLTKIYVGDKWDTTGKDTTNMFSNCGTSTVTRK